MIVFCYIETYFEGGVIGRLCKWKKMHFFAQSTHVGVVKWVPERIAVYQNATWSRGNDTACGEMGPKYKEEQVTKTPLGAEVTHTRADKGEVP